MDIFKERIHNTSVESLKLTYNKGENLTLPNYINAGYSDGITRKLPLKWENSCIDSNQTGEYEIAAEVLSCEYPNPFITERADPYIFKAPNGMYYFTASFPAYQSAEKGYDRIILRESITVSGLAVAPEHIIWKSHEKGEMSRHIWAPEIHYINNKWYIFFAAGEKENVWNIRPFVLMCEEDNPITGEWKECGKMQGSDGDEISFTNFSLDMTYFEHKGRHYLIWAQIYGDSSLFMAEINPDAPWRLISKPILLTKPEYPWEIIKHRVNEGASVLKTEDRIYVFFSASGTGSEYCMGVIYADKDKDLTDKNSWIKINHPLLQTEDLKGENGPGHNSFVCDEKGQLLLVYHARPEEHLSKSCGSYCDESLYDPCRHARIRYVFMKDGKIPLINLSEDEIISPRFKKITAKVTII